MPTSTAERSNRRADVGGASVSCDPAAGFTLIEIALVILIISIVLALAIPRLRTISGAELSKQARRLSNTFRLLRSESILNGRAYQLNYDLNQQRYWITAEGQGPDLSAGTQDLGPLANPVSLLSPVAISDVVLPESVGKVLAGTQAPLFTTFYPDGYIDLTVIHLDDGREAYTLWVNPLTGRIALNPGYQDVDYGR